METKREKQIRERYFKSNEYRIKLEDLKKAIENKTKKNKKQLNYNLFKI